MQQGWCQNPINFISSGVFRIIVLVLLGGGDTGMAVWARFTEGTRSVGFAAHGGGFLAGTAAAAASLSLACHALLCAKSFANFDAVCDTGRSAVGYCTGGERAATCPVQ